MFILYLFVIVFVMYTIYQTDLWKDIQEDVYHKHTCMLPFLGREYFTIIKEKKIGPFVTRWYQILGVELPDNVQYVREEIHKLKTLLKKDRKHIFLQLGIVNEMVSFENISHRSQTFKQDMRDMRLHIRDYLCKTYNVQLSFRENMPQSNIVYDITKSDEQLMSEMNSGCKERVKKAIKNNIIFSVADPDQYEDFFHQWVRLAGDKGFNTITYKQYQRLISYITDNACGNIFIAHKDGELVAGSICVYDVHRIIYLYGFSNRKFGNIGGHHFLKFKIFGRAREYGLTYCDMLGGAPTGFPDHDLASVSAFKESLGGIKIEYYGNYDVILNPLLYKLFLYHYKWRKS